jgi:hypothetical protein
MPTKAAKKKLAPKAKRSKPSSALAAPARRAFVGRPSSPVLAKYPPKASGVAGPPPVRPVTAAPAAPVPPPPPSPARAAPVELPMTGEAPKGLISLDRPFDVDEFSQSLGENQVRVVVPREDLPEVLRRVLDFMGFGIYVYQFRVYPESEEMLRKFVVELQRVDFVAARRSWLPFEEKGRSDSPFGPGDRPRT